jgi:hypothetical protein
MITLKQYFCEGIPQQIRSLRLARTAVVPKQGTYAGVPSQFHRVRKPNTYGFWGVGQCCPVSIDRRCWINTGGIHKTC